MPTKAFVLIETAVGKTKDVADIDFFVNKKIMFHVGMHSKGTHFTESLENRDLTFLN